MPPQTADRKAYRKWYHAHEPQSVKDARRAWKKTPKGKACVQNTHLKKTYGITLEYKNQLLKLQSYRCAICMRPETDFKKGLSVDHNHETNRVRGLLCFMCNTALETLENPQYCSRASLYLGNY